MKRFYKYIFIFVIAVFAVEAFAQTNIWRDIYKVKKKDTIYGIATSYGLSVDDLIEANPEMKEPGYKLKKGATVFIPNAKPKPSPAETAQQAAAKQANKPLRVGVMLPLHDVDGDGKRMVEYYRGLLVGADSLRNEGVNTEFYSWNVAIDSDIRIPLLDEKAKKLDVIFGPLYTKQVAPLADFCRRNNIKLVIPFSISATDVQTNPQVFQVYQNGVDLNKKAISAFQERFKDCNVVLIDCNDTTSNKGIFTFGLRKELEAKGVEYQITNLKSSLERFSQAFLIGKKNVVILNTGRSNELNLAFRKLNELTAIAPGLEISMFGYGEWVSYERVFRELYHKYDVYIPSTYYYYKGLSRIAAFERNYQHWFNTTLQEQYIPRFAITGFDHAQFFLRGLKKYGSAFQGTSKEVTNRPLQTPLRFKKASAEGGMQNYAFELVHYKHNKSIETIEY